MKRVERQESSDSSSEESLKISEQNIKKGKENGHQNQNISVMNMLAKKLDRSSGKNDKKTTVKEKLD